MSNAMELILTAKTIKAEEAERIGLVSHVYPAEELMDKAITLANAIAANAQVAVRQSKAAIRRGLQTDMATGAAFEAEAFGLCFSTEDQKDAMKAFVNKEKGMYKIVFTSFDELVDALFSAKEICYGTYPLDAKPNPLYGKSIEWIKMQHELTSL